MREWRQLLNDSIPGGHMVADIMLSARGTQLFDDLEDLLGVPSHRVWDNRYDRIYDPTTRLRALLSEGQRQGLITPIEHDVLFKVVNYGRTTS